ncbi:MAG: cation:proton antiporter subunit C [Nanoarchaeota archaeon]|nr:cation:proton antiporter subunit C [Nanoarchaeota archaeon]MBU1134940.1 cation:proton antiporter subunit C [Nanoarchaeota archaeon]MBU2519811.1 cation:proton antiporter subunit C [Nanoarchaeota archaeon]
MLAYIASMLLLIIGAYTLVMKDNLIKKIMGLSVFSSGIHIFLISLGYRAGGIPPLLTNLNFNQISAIMVDPLPQALVLTSIVINLSITAFAMAIIVDVYREFGTLNIKKLKSLRG